MTSGQTSPSQSPSTGGRQEIPDSALSKHRASLCKALDTVCASPSFRTSPKSCEFLRHIVMHALNGATDVLKERLIGMALLGRDASYDTATDAGVRVRANDVRKRLIACNKALDNRAQYAFGLPAGTYIPVFYGPCIEAPAPPIASRSPSMLTLYRLATPTMVALFLCVIFVRAEFAQSRSFLSFWSHVFSSGQATLYRQPSSTGAPPNVAHDPSADVSLLRLAQELHQHFSIVDSPVQVEGGTLVYIASDMDRDSRPSGSRPAALSSFPGATAAARFVLSETPTGLRILDRQSPHANGVRGALLTIVDGPHPLLRIDGVDDHAVRMMMSRLCEQRNFPPSLADSFQTDTLTQAVFPDSPGGEITVFHAPLSNMQLAGEVAP